MEFSRLKKSLRSQPGHTSRVRTPEYVMPSYIGQQEEYRDVQLGHYQRTTYLVGKFDFVIDDVIRTYVPVCLVQNSLDKSRGF